MTSTTVPTEIGDAAVIERIPETGLGDWMFVAVFLVFLGALLIAWGRANA